MGIGAAELIIVLLVLGLLTILAAIAIVFCFTRRKPPQPPQSPPSAQERLAAIEDLRARNQITEAEYEEKRRQILGSI